MEKDHEVIQLPGQNLVFLPEYPDEALALKIKDAGNAILVLQCRDSGFTGPLKAWAGLLEHEGIRLPLVLKIVTGITDPEERILNCAVVASCLFADGLADGLWIDNPAGELSATGLSFMILQATRARITATEYISCPSCGRTRFDIQAAARNIKARTSHLKGLKIGIMGCIVNGPGEMADADYGYVGAGNGLITLYKGKEVMRRGIREEEAIDALVHLIKENGEWIEP